MKLSGTMKINGVDVPIELNVPDFPTTPVDPPPVDPPPVDPPPVDPGSDIPTAKKIVQVTPGNWRETLGVAARAEPGTHFVLSAGTYDMEAENLGGTFEGTASDPIVIRADGDAVITAMSWTQGMQGSIWKLKGSHVILSGLKFGRTISGRHLNIVSSQWYISTDWRILDCSFTESHNHSVVVQGKQFLFERCDWRGNCLRNEHRMLGMWPYVVGTWAYNIDASNETQSEDVVFRSCTCVDNFGEGIHPSYVKGATVEDCVVHDNLFVNIYFNNASRIICRRNRLVSQFLMLTRFGEPPRGIEMATENLYPSAENREGNVPVLIEDNLIDGGLHQGVRRGIAWSKHEGTSPWNKYAEVVIRCNIIRNCKDALIEFDKIPAATSYGNSIDVPLDSPGVIIADPQWWEVK